VGSGIVAGIGEKGVTDIVNSDDPVPIDENVRGLEIAVDDSTEMQFSQSEDDFGHTSCDSCASRHLGQIQLQFGLIEWGLGRDIFRIPRSTDDSTARVSTFSARNGRYSADFAKLSPPAALLLRRIYVRVPPRTIRPHRAIPRGANHHREGCLFRSAKRRERSPTRIFRRGRQFFERELLFRRHT
jgi:hypothetical protein